MSEVWKEQDSCTRCSGQVAHLNEKMGFIDSVPRLLNAGGIALGLFAVLYLAYKIIADDLGKGEGISVMVLFAVGTLMLVASLLIQVRAGTMAIRKASDRGEFRPTRKVKGGPGVRRGRMDMEDRERRAPPRATKLPIRER
jgi:hypothetical protein